MNLILCLILHTFLRVKNFNDLFSKLSEICLLFTYIYVYVINFNFALLSGLQEITRIFLTDADGNLK